VSAVSEADLADVRRLLEVNLVSCFVTAKQAVGRLTAGHSLTFIASHAALYGSARWAAYSASKAGVVSLTQALAQETGRLGPRVNCVSPGSVESPMMDVVLARAATERQLPVEQIRMEAELASPLARFATPQEVAGVCVFLASPAAGYITGANIVINGGERPG
jgi:NAD(P)-dependent dehydrogenase (short-subunit alcohol dehydrogenase family)